MTSEPIYADHVFAFLKEIVSYLRGSHRQQAELMDIALKHYVFPLTSEFYGKAMIALRDVVDSRPETLTSQQLERARYFADAIKTQWFSA